MKASVSQETDEACHSLAPKMACEYSASYWSKPGDLIGYIYLDNVPKTTTTKKITTEKKTSTTTTTTTKKKSNNANLMNLEIEELNWQFDSSKDNFEISVFNDIESINVVALAEDESATIDGLGKYSLNVGENIIEIIVTAEDESKKSYTLSVIREEEKQRPRQDDVTLKKEPKNLFFIAFMISGIMLILMLVVIVIIIRKKKGRK